MSRARVSGAFVHDEVRLPALLGWPSDALNELAAGYHETCQRVARKCGLNASRNGPHNQVNSTVAIEAEVVEAEASNR